MKKALSLLCVLCMILGLLPAVAAADDDNVLYVYNWYDYIDEAVLEIYPDYDPTKETLPEYLARKEAEKNSEPQQPTVTEEDIKFALFGGAGEITDEMYDEVKAFVQFVKMKHGQA